MVVAVRLSVSCIGSNGLKPSPSSITPYSSALSVSCIGSNGLKPYLRRQLGRDAYLLSVSCIGSNGLKLPVNVCEKCSLPAFSILYRIEWVETLSLCRNRRRPCPFSILYRIEWVETLPSRGGRVRGKFFQYPVSDRMG